MARLIDHVHGVLIVNLLATPTAPGSWAAAGTSGKRETVFPLQVSFRFTQNISVDNFQYVLKAFASPDQESEIKVEPLSETQ